MSNDPQTALTLIHTIQRLGGTVIPMPPSQDSPNGKSYHFKPTEAYPGDHVAVVSDRAHIGKFLQVETFELAPPPMSSVPQTSSATPHSAAASDAGTSGGGGVEGAATGQQLGEATETENDSANSEAVTFHLFTPDEVSELGLEQVIEAHKYFLDRKPHHNAKRETMEAALNAEIAERIEKAQALHGQPS